MKTNRRGQEAAQIDRFWPLNQVGQRDVDVLPVDLPPNGRLGVGRYFEGNPLRRRRGGGRVPPGARRKSDLILAAALPIAKRVGLFFTGLRRDDLVAAKARLDIE